MGISFFFFWLAFRLFESEQKVEWYRAIKERFTMADLVTRLMVLHCVSRANLAS